jgi:hypothetical protein
MNTASYDVAKEQAPFIVFRKSRIGFSSSMPTSWPGWAEDRLPHLQEKPEMVWYANWNSPSV